MGRPTTPHHATSLLPVRALAPSANLGAKRSLARTWGGDGASLACLLVLRCLSRTSTTPIRRHRVCAVVLAQHPTHGERWQLTGCLEGQRTACVAMPAMGDASTLCLRLVGSASHGLRVASLRDRTAAAGW
eukprot:scaffold22425_cov88-Phaeocystis_antarctica.AAC.2